jgi:hypothetical protein
MPMLKWSNRHINSGRFQPTGEIVVEAYPLAEILEAYMPPQKRSDFFVCVC